jgi:hypothetical protein
MKRLCEIINVNIFYVLWQKANRKHWICPLANKNIAIHIFSDKLL